MNTTLKLPTEQDSLLAQDSLHFLMEHQAEDLNVQVASKTMRLPPVAARLLKQILSEIAEGNAVAVTPIQPEISTQEAADLLNVSRPYLVGLLEQQIIPHRKIGKHRRVPLKALLEYKAMQKAKAERAMQELADLSQKLGLGY